MSKDYKTRDFVLCELRKRGVWTSELIVVVRSEYVFVGGQVNSFYEHQLIQQFANRIQNEMNVEIDVMVSTPTQTLPGRSEAQRSATEIHQLRNRLNRLVVGLGLAQQALSIDDLALGSRIINELLASETPSASARSRPLQDRLAGKSILILENDLNQSLLLGGLLRQMGARVTQRRTAEAVRALLQSRSLPDLMLVDLHLTGEQGTQFAQWFQTMYPNAPTVLIAVSASRPDIANLEETPFAHWIPKPINIERLISAILASES